MEGEGGGRSGEWCHVYALEWCNVAGCGPVEIGRGFCGPGQNYDRLTKMSEHYLGDGNYL